MINCTKKKTQYRVHEILSNGQHFNLYFNRTQNGILDNGEQFSTWTVGLIISDTRKHANLWYNGKIDKDITGRCGLEGIKKALDYILFFRDNIMYDDMLKVEWEDERRKRAYSRLLKYGFMIYENGYWGINDNYRKWNLEVLE